MAIWDFIIRIHFWLYSQSIFMRNSTISYLIEKIKWEYISCDWYKNCKCFVKQKNLLESTLKILYIWVFSSQYTNLD